MENSWYIYIKDFFNRKLSDYFNPNRDYTIFILISLVTIVVMSYLSYRNIKNDPYKLGFLLFGLSAVSVLGFFVRQHLRKLYGIIEFLLGVTFTSNYITDVYPTLASLLEMHPIASANGLTWTAVIGGIYIMIRGFDNVGKGLKADKIKVDFHNSELDRTFDVKVRREAEILWIIGGKLDGSEKENWYEAESIISQEKKDCVFANFWGGTFGFD